MRALLTGLAAGLVAGWLLCWGGLRPVVEGTGTHPAPGAEARVIQEGGDALRRAPQLAAEGQSEAASSGAHDTPPRGPERSELIRSGSALALFEALAAHARLSDDEAAALIERVGDAHRARDTQLFLRLLGALGASEHPACHAYLVALAADVERPLPEEFAKTVHPYLLTTHAEGVVAAAQARIESERRNALWVEIVVQRGRPADIDALLARRDQRVHPTPIYVLLMARPLPEALSYLARAEARGAPDVNITQVLPAFARAHPDEAREMMAAGIRAFDAGASSWKGIPDAGWLLAVYISTLRADDWPAATELFLSLRDSDVRLAALRVLQTYSFRGFDYGPLASLLELPGEQIRALVDARPVPADASRRLSRLLSAMEVPGPALTEANVAAYEYAARVWQGAERDALQATAARLRADLEADAWR